VKKEEDPLKDVGPILTGMRVKNDGGTGQSIQTSNKLDAIPLKKEGSGKR